MVMIETDDDERLLSVRFESTDVREIPELTGSLTLREHASAILKANGRPMETADILSCMEAENRIVKKESLEVVLSRNKRSFYNGRNGWGLTTPREAN